MYHCIRQKDSLFLYKRSVRLLGTKYSFAAQQTIVWCPAYNCLLGTKQMERTNLIIEITLIKR